MPNTADTVQTQGNLPFGYGTDCGRKPKPKAKHPFSPGQLLTHCEAQAIYGEPSDPKSVLAYLGYDKKG